MNYKWVSHDNIFFQKRSSLTLSISSVVSFMTSGKGIIEFKNSWDSATSIDPNWFFDKSNFFQAFSNFYPSYKNYLLNSRDFLGPFLTSPFHFWMIYYANFKAFFLLKTYLFKGLPSYLHTDSEKFENSKEKNFWSSCLSAPGV